MCSNLLRHSLFLTLRYKFRAGVGGGGVHWVIFISHLPLQVSITYCSTIISILAMVLLSIFFCFSSLNYE